MKKKHRKDRAIGRSDQLGVLLRDVRQRAGESLKSSAPDLGVTYTYLSKIENGVVSPSSELLSRIATRYELDSDLLYNAAGKLPPDVTRILRQHTREVVDLLRRHFGNLS